MISSSESETRLFGRTIAKQLGKNSIVALHGDLGSGKTTFVKGVVEELTQISDREIQSPTFTYLNIYNGPFPIYHFDLYRLKDAEAFLRLGFTDYLHDGGICLIEWAERIESLLANSRLSQIHFIHIEEEKRRIDVQLC